MKYVILIHADPKPWAHPTARFTDEGRALSAAEHEPMDRAFDALLAELSASGELVSAEARARGQPRPTSTSGTVAASRTRVPPWDGSSCWWSGCC